MMRASRTWAVAVRGRPEQIGARRDPAPASRRPPLAVPIGAAAPPRAALADRARRRRARRVADDRLQALDISANAQPGPRSDGAAPSSATWAGTLVVSLLFAVGLFFVVPFRLAEPRQGPARLRLAVLDRRGRRSGRRSSSATSAALAPARPAARLRVPRRRAQGDLPLRGRRAARAGRARSGFSRLHPRCGTAFLLVVMLVADLRLRSARAAGLVRGWCRRASSACRSSRASLRGHQVRGPQPRPRLGARASCGRACSCSA